jgi:hypothetical protein
LSRQLANYLQQLALEGERHSEGLFTIDYARALEQLSNRLFSDPTSYLLKAIQAAFAAGAPEVQIRTHRDRLELSFTSPVFTSAAFGSVSDWLNQPLRSEQERGFAHLLRSFHAARAMQTLQIGLAVQDEHGGVTCLVEGEHVQSQTMPAKPGAGAECVLFFRHLDPNAVKGRPHNWLPEQSSLQARCALTSRPVRWDGKVLNPQPIGVDARPAKFPVLLDRVYLSRDTADKLLALPHLTNLPAVVYDVGGGYQDLYSNGQTLLHQWRTYASSNKHEPALFHQSFRPDFKVLESDLMQELLGIAGDACALNHGFMRSGRVDGGKSTGYQILYVPNPDTFTMTSFAVTQGRFGKRPCLCAQAWVRCPSLPRGDSFFHVQQDGVLLDPVGVELPLAGVQLIVADQEVKTDLSGLVPVADERMEAVAAWFRVDLMKSKKELRKALRWNDKYGLSEDWVKQVYRAHRLDRDDLNSQ